MKKMVVVLNKLSGNSNKVDEKKVVDKLSSEYEILRVCVINKPSDKFDLSDCECVAVYGGDGTLNNVLKKLPDRPIEILYCPTGTLNELGNTLKHKCAKKPLLMETGELAGRRFAYVAAAGIFTQIGSNASTKDKKRFKVVAYFGEVLRNYKVAHIGANIKTDNGDFEGEYTLVMFIDSNRCFGFRFNHLYNQNDGRLHMLLIRAPKGSGLWAKIKVFFPLFRVFFLGLRKEKRAKNIVFVPISSAKAILKKEQKFCFDGECQSVSGEFEIKVKPLSSPVQLLKL